MVILHKSDVVRFNDKITVHQSENDILLVTENDKMVIPKHLLPDLVRLLDYISGYFDFTN